MIEVFAVYAMLHIGAGRTWVMSRHLTETACREAMIERLSGNGWPQSLTCVPGYMKVERHPDKPPAVTNPWRTSISREGGTCYGDDRFCGRTSP